MVSAKVKIRQMQGAERPGQIHSQTNRQGNRAGWSQRNPSSVCTHRRRYRKMGGCDAAEHSDRRKGARSQQQHTQQERKPVGRKDVSGETRET